MKIKSLSLPGSKSVTNRAILLASVSAGQSVIRNPLFSDDTLYMIESLKKIGFEIGQNENSLRIQGNPELKVKKQETELFIGNAGTVIRFLVSLLSLLEGGVFTVRGEQRMHERPIGDLVEPLKKAGADITYLEKEGYPPLRIKGKKYSFDSIEMDGSKSSQYISSVLMLFPLINPKAKIRVKDLVSKPYIQTTLDSMKDFGVFLENKNYESFYLKSGTYQAQTFDIPADASSASYFFAGAFLKNKPIELNLGRKCMQGDFLFIEILREMGGLFEIEDNHTVFLNRRNDFPGLTVDMNEIPDTTQTLAALSLFANGPTRIQNVANLRIKETDRLSALENEISRLGIKAVAGPDFIHIDPSQGGSLKPADIETYHDHRMAMSFAIAGLRIPGLRIKNPEVVSKSFTHFFDIWKEVEAL